MQINLFNGGLNTFSQPHLLKTNESVVCENADIASGVVKSRKKNKLLAKNKKGSIWKFKNNWVDSKENRDYVEFQNKLFYSDGFNEPKYSTNGNQWFKLGIDKPNEEDLKIEYYNATNYNLNIKLLYGFDKGRDHPVVKTYNLRSNKNQAFEVKQYNISRFLNYREGRVNGYYSWDTPKLEIFRNFSLECYEIDGSSVGSLNVGTYKEFIDAGASLAPVVESCRTTYYPYTVFTRGVPMSEVTDEGRMKGLFPYHNYYTSFYCKSEKDEKFYLRYSRWANNGVRGRYCPDCQRETDWSLYVSTENVPGAAPFQGEPLIMTPKSEVVFVLKNKEGKILSFNPVTLPDNFEDKNFTQNPGNGAVMCFAGFSFDWVFQDEQIIDIYIDGFKHSTKKKSDLKSGRIIIPSEIIEKDTFNTLEKVISELENVSYVMTYEGDFVESRPSEEVKVPDLANTTDVKVVLRLQASPDPQVKHINIYRLGKSLTDFSLVTKLPNQTQTFVDFKADDEIDGAILNSYQNYPAPKGLTNLMLSNVMLFGSIGARLVFTNIGKPYTWYPLNYIDFDDNITGIGDTPNGLLVFTKYKTFIVVGTSPDTFSKYLLSGKIGCASHKSIQTINNKLLWVSEEGVNISNGGEIVNLTKSQLAPNSVINPLSSCVTDEMYFVSHSKGTSIFDFRGASFIITQLREQFQSLHAVENKVYGVDVLGDFYELFGNTSDDTFVYKTATFADGSLTNLKTYKNIYFSSTGTLKAKIFIDDVLANEVELRRGVTEAKVNAEDLQGYSISFEIEGTGQLNEIEYKAEGRQNGR